MRSARELMVHHHATRHSMLTNATALLACSETVTDLFVFIVNFCYLKK